MIKLNNYGFNITKLLPFSTLIKWIMVNLNRQNGNMFSSIYTNGFIIFTLISQSKVHDIAKLTVPTIFPNISFFHFENMALSG
jgi:hypothetical protein